MSGIIVVFDATHTNISALPANSDNVAGYATGSSDVAWTTEDREKYPNAIMIDQSPAKTPWDVTADVDDYESKGVQLSELAPRAKLRQQAYRNGTRPGQRSPLVYVSGDNVTPVANALIAGGVTSGVGLWVADWDLTQSESIAKVTAGAGPFPIEGVQFLHQDKYDMSVFNGGWFNGTSVKPIAAPNNAIANYGIQDKWRFCSKCSTLANESGPQVCAGGGKHDLGHSHNFTISWADADN